MKISRETELESELERDALDSSVYRNQLDDGTVLTPTSHTIMEMDFNKNAEKYFNDNKIKVDLIFTSPPYNAGLKYENYDDARPINEYIKFLEEFLETSDVILNDGGRIVINIRDIKIASGSRYPPLVTFFQKLCIEKGYKYRGVHIWYKGREESSTAWGSWRSCANPSIIDLFEYVYVFQKSGERVKKNHQIDKEEFIECDLGVWKIRPVKKIHGKNKNNKAGHPCPFPVELAERVIKLYSYPQDIVVDPFGGVGSTSMAAYNCGRNSYSIDISKKYTELAYVNLKHLNPKMNLRVISDDHINVNAEMVKNIVELLNARNEEPVEVIKIV